MDVLHSNNSLPIILSGQNVFLTLTFGAVFDTQNTIPSHLNILCNFLSGHPDIRTSGRNKIQNQKNVKLGKKHRLARDFSEMNVRVNTRCCYFIFFIVYIFYYQKNRKNRKKTCMAHISQK